MKRVFMTLLLCYICAFVLMVTSICTSSWYTTHPLAPTEETSYGSLGLIEHCSTTNGVCTERTDILKFTDGFWPYRPLKNKVFDAALLMLMLSMICTISSLGVTFLLCFQSYNKKRWLKWLLLLLSIKSVILGVCGVWFIDSRVRSEIFRRSWSTYITWLSVGLSALANIPVVYLLRHKQTTSENVKLNDWREENRVDEYVLNETKQSNSKHFHYSDIHDVE